MRGCSLAWPEREVPYLEPSGSPENPWAVACVRVLVVPAVHGCLVAVLACPGPRRLRGVCTLYLIPYTQHYEAVKLSLLAHSLSPSPLDPTPLPRSVALLNPTPLVA